MLDGYEFKERLTTLDILTHVCEIVYAHELFRYLPDVLWARVQYNGKEGWVEIPINGFISSMFPLEPIAMSSKAHASKNRTIAELFRMKYFAPGLLTYQKAVAKVKKHLSFAKRAGFTTLDHGKEVRRAIKFIEGVTLNTAIKGEQ